MCSILSLHWSLLHITLTFKGSVLTSTQPVRCAFKELERGISLTTNITLCFFNFISTLCPYRTLSDSRRYERVNVSSRGPPVPSRNTSQPTVPAAPLPARRGRRLTERQGRDRGVSENSEGYGSREDLTDNPAYGVNSLGEEEEGYASPQPADPDEEDVTYY